MPRGYNSGTICQMPRNPWPNARALGATGEFWGFLREVELRALGGGGQEDMNPEKDWGERGWCSRCKGSQSWGAGKKLMPLSVQSQAALLEAST